MLTSSDVGDLGRILLPKVSLNTLFDPIMKSKGVKRVVNELIKGKLGC